MTATGKPWATWVEPRDAAFLWRVSSDASWPALSAAAVDYLMSVAVGGGVGSRQVAETTGMHPRAARALLYEWQATGAVRSAHELMPIGIVAYATGLRP